jgi:leucyl-tRNA---protein transferase
MTSKQKNPEIFLSMPHPCSYLEGKIATTLFIDPRYPIDGDKYGRLMHLGFRRSGDLVYRPHCRSCDACIPVRIPVERFQPNRSQRRVWKRNADLTVTARDATFVQEHFDLYLHYQRRRHAGGGMDDPDPRKYIDFLVGCRIETRFYEMRMGHRLVGVAVSDRISDGLSAVYTFFDPDEISRGLGTYAILWQIDHAKSLNLHWVYLGYLIRESPKMAYKANFQPLETYLNGHWETLTS